MEIKDRTILILGGSGMVGRAVARKLLDFKPARIVLVALTEAEVVDAKDELNQIAGSTRIEALWGNIFVPSSVAKLTNAERIENPEHRRAVLDDLLGDMDDDVLHRSFLYEVFDKYKPEAVVDGINTATALAYTDVYHSAGQLLAAARRGEATAEVVEKHMLTLTMPPLIRHIQIILATMKRLGTLAYVKVGTSGTGGMGLNVPYTHSEERPSRAMLMKSAVAGAHSLLLFLVARTPGAPATKEVKPTATIGWRDINFGPVMKDGKPIRRFDCPEPRDVREGFGEDANYWTDTGKSLESVYASMGENGVFAREEFETVTALGSMELITPEEVAEYVISEIRGFPTGRDIVTALDSATAGPTYKAGVLRQEAIERLRELESEFGVRSVAFEMLGPPRLTKILYEGYVFSLLRGSVAELAASEPGKLSAEACELIASSEELRSNIVSVGIPIVVGGDKIYRAEVVMVPPGSDFEAAVPRGWVDLRESNCSTWIARAARVVKQTDERVSVSGSGSGIDWRAMEPADPISPARFATWVFRYEDDGERMKR